MGRTLHINFKKENNKKFTDKEIELFIQVREKYNTGKFEKVWCCESFYPNPINFYPAWDSDKRHDINHILKQELKDGDGYDYMAYIERKVKELMAGKAIKIGSQHEYSFNKKLSRVEACKFLAREKWIVIDNAEQKEIRTFVKVQGNEFNAALTFLAVKELSMLIPTMEARISDEGEFLLCPIKMKQGKALPLLNEMVDSIQNYCFKMMFSTQFQGNILNDLDYQEKDFCHEFKMGLQLGNSYGDMVQYINETLRNIKEVEKRIYDITPNDNWGGKCSLYFDNMGNTDLKNWYDADLFTRISQINPNDFVTYKMTPATLMDDGASYYGLSDKDAEAESYKRIAQMQAMFGKLGITQQLEVLGEK